MLTYYKIRNYSIQPSSPSLDTNIINRISIFRIMRKILVLLIISLISLITQAQDYKDSDYYYYDGIENHNAIGISSEQKSKIISIKKSISKRHAAIGESGLRGNEKGQAHRKLNREIRKEIDDILNSDQRIRWEKGRSSVHTERYSREYANEKEIDRLEDKIDDLEDYYEDLIDDIEDDKNLPKSVRKARKIELEAEMKAKKRELKRAKEILKDSKY